MYTNPDNKSCLLCEQFRSLKDYKFNNQKYVHYNVVEIYSSKKPSEMYTGKALLIRIIVK